MTIRQLDEVLRWYSRSMKYSLEKLNAEFGRMQEKYGAENLDAIHGGGCERNPEVCFVFMNPTGRNIAAAKNWKGIKAPWVGTKGVWELFFELGLLDKNIYEKIHEIKGSDWTEDFAEEVYGCVKKKRYYVTNLAKCTQVDARPLPDEVFEKYLELFLVEMELVKPKIVVLFGNQVSSIVLGSKVSVSLCRKKKFEKNLGGRDLGFYAVYYPVGNGRFNIGKAKEDLKWISTEQVV